MQRERQRQTEAQAQRRREIRGRGRGKSRSSGSGRGRDRLKWLTEKSKKGITDSFILTTFVLLPFVLSDHDITTSSRYQRAETDQEACLLDGLFCWTIKASRKENEVANETFYQRTCFLAFSLHQRHYRF